MPPTRTAMGLLLVGLVGILCSCRSPASSPPAQSRVGLISSSPVPTLSSAPATMKPVSSAEIAATERAARLDSRDIQAHIRLADLYIHTGKQPEAARVLRAILRTQPRTVEAYRRLAILYRAAGYPERFAQEALGHASAAIHRAYAKSVRVELPPLEDYEREQSKTVPLPKSVEGPPLSTAAQT